MWEIREEYRQDIARRDMSGGRGQIGARHNLKEKTIGTGHGPMTGGFSAGGEWGSMHDRS